MNSLNLQREKSMQIKDESKIEVLTDKLLHDQMVKDHLIMKEQLQKFEMRPYEQGLLYMNALDKGLFPSIRKMCKQLLIDYGNVSKYIALAKLPKEVIDAFPSTDEIKQAWATNLSKAVKNNEAHVLKVAAEIQRENPRPSSQLTFERLTKNEVDTSGKKYESSCIDGIKRQAGTLDFKMTNQGIRVVIDLDNFDHSRLSDVKHALRSAVSQLVCS